MMVIYGKEMCEWCDKAKELCRQYGIVFEYRPIDDRFVGEANFNILKEQVKADNLNVKTVPAIWHHNKYIGGYTELNIYIENTREYGQGDF